MSIVHETPIAGGALPSASVPVWDLFVRVFHWSLVGLFAVAYLSGEHAGRVHVLAGYTIAGLLALRIAWGCIGPRHARFSDFVRPPGVVVAHVRDAMLLRARRYLGHNPAGGLMVLALIAMLIATSVTGYLMMTDSGWGSETLEEVHGALANATVALIALHVLGVLATSFAHGENLVKAMISGRKRRA